MYKNFKQKTWSLQAFYTCSLAVTFLSLASLTLALSNIIETSYLVTATLSWVFIVSSLLPGISYTYTNTEAIKNIHYRYMIYLVIVSATLVSSLIELGVLQSLDVLGVNLIFVGLSVVILLMINLFYN